MMFQPYLIDKTFISVIQIPNFHFFSNFTFSQILLSINSVRSIPYPPVKVTDIITYRFLFQTGCILLIHSKKTTGKVRYYAGGFITVTIHSHFIYILQAHLFHDPFDIIFSLIQGAASRMILQQISSIAKLPEQS